LGYRRLLVSWQLPIEVGRRHNFASNAGQPRRVGSRPTRVVFIWAIAKSSIMPRTPAAVTFTSRAARAALVLAGLSGASVALASVFAPVPAWAQDVSSQALEQRVERLESDLAILQRQVYTGAGGVKVPAPAAPVAALNNSPPPPTVAAGLDERISRLEDQVQALTGRIEEIGHNADTVKALLDKLSKDVDFRLTALEKGGAAPAGPNGSGAPVASSPGNAPAAGPAGSEAPPAPATLVPGSGQVLPVGTPQQQYDYARALLIQQDYANAEKAFAAFLNVHPDDALAGSAQFWLGETYYVRGNFDQAAKAFAEGFQRYPKSAKAPDTLLKLGMSLTQLNRKKDACGIYSALDQRYPNASATIKQAAQRERQRAGCA
jgi:tol-pal system protein YbgF